MDKTDTATTAEVDEVTRTEAAEVEAATYKTQVHWRTLTLVERMQTRPEYRDKYRLEFSEPYNGRQEFDDVHSSIRRLDDDTSSSDSDSDTDWWLFHNLRDKDFRILWQLTKWRPIRDAAGRRAWPCGIQDIPKEDLIRSRRWM